MTASWCPFLSQQPTLGVRGVPHVSQSRLTSITKHQTHCSSLSILYLFKTHRYRFFFSFLGILGNKSFPPTASHWHVGFVYCCFSFSFFVPHCKPVCVVRTQWVGSYKYRSKCKISLCFVLEPKLRETSRVSV